MKQKAKKPVTVKEYLITFCDHTGKQRKQKKKVWGTSAGVTYGDDSRSFLVVMGLENEPIYMLDTCNFESFEVLQEMEMVEEQPKIAAVREIRGDE